MTTSARPRVGRPRHAAAGESVDQSPREEILAAAAALFVENGFAATTTRAIAERVGIRQASLYYHFAGKDDLLMELLTTSVRPSLDVVDAILERAQTHPAGALWALTTIDVGTLTASPHNIATLYMLPEVQSERYADFHEARRALRSAYAALGTAAASDDVRTSLGETQLGEILIQIAELVIQLRRERVPTEADAHAIAATCLRACGLGESGIHRARAEGEIILRELAD